MSDPANFRELRGKDPDTFSSYQSSGEKWLQTLEDKEQNRVDKLAGNSAIGQLEFRRTREDGTIDFEGIRKDLSNPQFRKENGLLDSTGSPNRKVMEAVDSYFKSKEIEQREVTKQNHDKYEKDVGRLFSTGKMSDVMKMVNDPNSLLTGDEAKTWANAVDTRFKEIKAEKKEGQETKEAAAIIIANDMMRKKEDPAKVRSFIIQNLTKGNLEQYINKLDTKLSQELERATHLGYQDIKDIIFPPARQMQVSTETLIQTPLHTSAIAMAQMALDSYIDSEVKKNKIPSVDEIRIKAYELATKYAPTEAQVMEYMARGSKGK
jgi:hypothetical protein